MANPYFQFKQFSIHQEHCAMKVSTDAMILGAWVNPGQATTILDIGTGTGIWAIDMADLYPSAVVTGTDLSPTQPSWVPPNVRFEVDDFKDEW